MSSDVVTEPSDPRGRWSALGRLAGAMVLAMTTWFSASAVLPQLRADWSLSTNQGSLLTIAVQLGFVAGAVTSAVLNLADLVPPRRLMLYGSLGAAAVNAGLVLADGPGLAIPLRFLTGVFLAGVYPPGLKSMATWFRRGRGTALGVMVGALTVGRRGAAPGQRPRRGAVGDRHPGHVGADAGRRAGGRVRRPGRPVPVPRRDLRPGPGPQGLR